MDFAKTMASFGGEHYEYLWTIKHPASGRKVFYPFTVFAQPLAEELFDENHCEAAFTNITVRSVRGKKAEGVDAEMDRQRWLEFAKAYSMQEIRDLLDQCLYGDVVEACRSLICTTLAIRMQSKPWRTATFRDGI
ncbi:hypothetical protein PG987_004680 [Apiospora arundinis]